MQVLKDDYIYFLFSNLSKNLKLNLNITFQLSDL